MTFKLCNNDCGKKIEVRRVDQKWIPFEESGEIHDCPNSEYNKKKRNDDLYTDNHPKFNPKAVITPQEASHDEPIVLEVPPVKQEYPYPQVMIIEESSPKTLEVATNDALKKLKNAGHVHKGTTLWSHGDTTWVNEIHYEILQPREERMKMIGGGEYKTNGK